MRRSGIVLYAFIILLVAGSSVAGPPLDGSYQSTDLGGPVLLGRYTEAWDVGGGALEVGTTLHAESWDPGGPALGTQWRYWCSTELVPSVLLVDLVDGSGNGNRTYQKTFSGGYIWLSGTGPWANGDPDYPGVIDTYYEFETITYSNWVPIAAVTSSNDTVGRFTTAIVTRASSSFALCHDGTVNAASVPRIRTAPGSIPSSVSIVYVGPDRTISLSSATR